MSESATQASESTSLSRPERMLLCAEKPGKQFTIEQVALMTGYARSTVKVYVGQNREFLAGDEKLHFSYARESVHVEEKDDELIVIASDPAQLVEAQQHLLAHMDKKIADAMHEQVEADELIQAAKMACVDESAAVRLKSRVAKDVVYLSKVRDALAAGYVIVPNFPGDAVAIRVNRRSARGQWKWHLPYYPRVGHEASDHLPTGEGRYVDPVPLHRIEKEKSDEGKVTYDLSFHGMSDAPIALPVQFMKPTLIRKLGEAMKLKLFDEVVLVTGSQEMNDGFHTGSVAGDPLIIGRVINNRAGSNRQQRHVTAFLIAWFFDTRDI